MADKQKPPSKMRHVRVKTEYDEWAEREAEKQGRTFGNFINWLLGRAKQEADEEEKAGESKDG